MKICVFGADGRTGVEVVKYALEKGHEVVAFVHNKNAEKYLPEDIDIVEGDILKYEDVEKAIGNYTDSIISVVGHVKGSDPLMQTKGIQNIVQVMHTKGVKRILSLTGTGARMKKDTPSFIDYVLNFFVRLVDPDRVRDGEEHLKVLENSDLDWTVLRVLKLTESEKEVQNYILTEGGPAELTTSRKKVAKILVDLGEEGDYIKKAPVVSG